MNPSFPTSSGVKMLAQKSTEKRGSTTTQISAVKLENRRTLLKHNVLDSTQNRD